MNLRTRVLARPRRLVFFVTLPWWTALGCGGPALEQDEQGSQPLADPSPLSAPGGAVPGHRSVTTVKPVLPAIDPAQVRASYLRVLREAEQKGTTHVLVKLNTPFAPEGFLSDVDRDDQRWRIRDHQGRIAAGLASKNLRNMRNLKQFRSTPMLALEADAATLKALSTLPEVAAISEDSEMFPVLAESVPMIGAALVAANTGNDGVGEIVGILDSGVDGTHPDLAGKVIDEACYSSNLCPGGATSAEGPGSAAPCTGIGGCEHGTMVAGVAAGRQGVAPGASIMAVKIVSMSSNCAPRPAPCIGARSSDTIQGLEHIQYSQRRVAAVNISYGDGTYHTTPCYADIEGTVANMRSVGIATILSSGNSAVATGSFQTGIGSPGCTISGVSVGSVTDGSDETGYADFISWWSQSAPFLSLLAPGEAITVPVPGGGYATTAGTSLAAPHVTGAFALMKSRQHFKTVDAIVTELRASGPTIGEFNGDTPIYFPRVQVDSALKLTPNLALYRPVTSSGNGCSPDQGPELAVNDQGFDKWCAFGRDQWLRVDLGSARFVKSFTIRHAGAGGEDASYNSKDFSIELSRDGSAWTKPVIVTNNTEPVTSHNLVTSELARYVQLNIVNPGTNPLEAARIYEFQVFGDPEASLQPSLALNKPATSSPTCDAGTPPSRAFDGKTIVEVSDRPWCSGDASPWLRVDLGAIALVDRIVLKKAGITGTENPGTNIRGYNVDVSVDNANWTNVATIRGATAALDVIPFAPVSARYVRLTVVDRGDDPYARVYELEVSGNTGTNVARGKTASGTTNCTSAQTPAKAVDGSTSSGDAKWCSKLSDKTKYWWKVDLGAANTLKWFTVRHAGVRESDALNTKNFTIQTSTDNTNWTTVATQTNNTAKITTHVIKPVSARYVRMNITAPTSNSDTAARVYEFEAYK